MSKKKKKSLNQGKTRVLRETKQFLSEKASPAEGQDRGPEQYAVEQTEGKAEQAVRIAASEGKAAVKRLLGSEKPSEEQRSLSPPERQPNREQPQKPSPAPKREPERLSEQPKVAAAPARTERPPLPDRPKPNPEGQSLQLLNDIPIESRSEAGKDLLTDRKLLSPQAQQDSLNTLPDHGIQADVPEGLVFVTREQKQASIPQEPFPGSSYESEWPVPEKRYGRRKAELEPEPERPSYNYQEKRKSDKLNLNKKDPAYSRELQTGKEAPLQTMEASPLANGLQNQAPTLSTASQAGENALKTFETMQEQAQVLENVGEGAMGAASGGTTTAVKVAKKVIEKVGEMLSDLAQQGLNNAKGVIGPVAALIFMPLLFVLTMAGALNTQAAQGVNLSDEVIALMPKIQEACELHGIPEYVQLVAAVMMQESGGNVELVNGDVMQCAEGMGYPVHTPVPVDESIDFGTSLLASYLHQAGSTGPTDLAAISLALQGYNYGNGYITWAMSHYGGYSRENAELFSEQQAVSHGWSSYGDTEYVPHVLRYYQVVGAAGDASAIAGGAFVYPLPGMKWNTYPGHEGIDIPVSSGTPIYATAAGTVTYTQGSWIPSMGYSGLASYGNCVFIDHGSGWESRYAHLSTITVASGSYVQQGQLIGYSGSTGNSSGPHLHLALYFSGSPASSGVIYAEQAWPQNKN